MIKKILWYINDFLNGMKKHQIWVYSAASAYFIFICVIPFLTILLYIIPYIPMSKESIVSIIGDVIPTYSKDFAYSIMNEVFSRTSAILPISILTMFWTASKTMVSIRSGLNDINEELESKNFVIVRLIGTLYTALAIVVIVLISFISLFGEQLHNYLNGFNIEAIRVLAVLVDYKDIIGIIGFFLAFSALYAYVPATKSKFKDVIPGAIFSTVVCQLFSKIFNFVVNNYLSFSMYGSLATIVVVMIYFNFFFYFFFLGAYLNKYVLRGINEI